MSTSSQSSVPLSRRPACRRDRKIVGHLSYRLFRLSTLPERWQEEGIKILGINILPESARIEQGKRLLESGHYQGVCDVADGKVHACRCWALWGPDRGPRHHALLEQMQAGGCDVYHNKLASASVRLSEAVPVAL